MPNGICHGCGLALNEFLTPAGEDRFSARIKNMAPWPIGKGKYGAIRHRDGEPDARCNGVVWFYGEDPTPPGGERYMSWFSNPLVSSAIKTFGGDPPPKPRKIVSAHYEVLHGGEQAVAERTDVTAAVKKLLVLNGCANLTFGLPLGQALEEAAGGVTAQPAPEGCLSVSTAGSEVHIGAGVHTGAAAATAAALPTARWMAALRSVDAASAYPAIGSNIRAGPDLAAQHFCGELGHEIAAAMAAAYKFNDLTPAAAGVTLRSVYFDARIMAAAQAGCRQFVILAAGLDARAWRLNGLPANSTIFELDVPEAHAYKNERVQRIEVSELEDPVHTC